MKVYNNTDSELSDIRIKKLLCQVRSNWRQRDIYLYEHKDPNMVYSVGIFFDGTTTVICQETKKQWDRELSVPGGFVVTN